LAFYKARIHTICGIPLSLTRTKPHSSHTHGFLCPPFALAAPPAAQAPRPQAPGGAVGVVHAKVGQDCNVNVFRVSYRPPSRPVGSLTLTQPGRFTNPTQGRPGPPWEAPQAECWSLRREPKPPGLAPGHATARALAQQHVPTNGCHLACIQGVAILVGVTTRLSLHDFLGSAANVFLLSQLCSSGHGAWGQCVSCRGAAKTARFKQIRAGMPARLPKCRAQKAPLILGQGGRFAEGFRENVVKSGHVVGFGSSRI